MARTLSYRQEVRALVRARACGLCEICGQQVNPIAMQTADDHASMHHRHMRRAGGQDAVSNLLYLCRRCHTNVVHRDEALALTNGWICAERHTSASPVWTWLGWKRLDEHGTYMSLPWVEAARLDESRGDALDLLFESVAV